MGVFYFFRSHISDFENVLCGTKISCLERQSCVLSREESTRHVLTVESCVVSCEQCNIEFSLKIFTIWGRGRGSGYKVVLGLPMPNGSFLDINFFLSGNSKFLDESFRRVEVILITLF